MINLHPNVKTIKQHFKIEIFKIPFAEYPNINIDIVFHIYEIRVRMFILKMFGHTIDILLVFLWWS